MNFDPTPEQLGYLEELRQVLAREIAPHVDRWDREAEVPAEALTALGKAGASGIYIPVENGGRGLDTVAYALAMEEIATHLPALTISFSVNNSLFANPIANFGTPEQKEKFLRPVASGEAMGAFALTEIGAGSDATRLATRATRNGSGYVINGEKVMVTNGGCAELFLVIAATQPEKTSRGLTAFVLPRETAGIRLGPREETLGMRSSDVRNLTLENVKVGEENRLGEENRGMSVLLESINSGRIGVGAQAVGIARGAYERALHYSRQRKQFNRFLYEIPAVQGMLADMATEIDAARLTVYHAAQVRDQGAAFFADAARAKLTAAEMCEHVASLAIQVHGGWGYMTATGVERFYRDAKVTQLYEGTSEMQRIILAASLTHG